MTRAYIACLHLEFSEAFNYHPMFWSLPLIVALFYHMPEHIEKSASKVFLWLCAFGFIVQWIYKLIQAS